MQDMNQPVEQIELKKPYQAPVMVELAGVEQTEAGPLGASDSGIFS